MSEFNQINLDDATDTNVSRSSDPVKQCKGDPVFGDSQSKGEDIFNKSLSGKAASVVEDITKGFFKEFFGAKFEEGDVPKEDISSKQYGVSEGNNVSEGVTAKKVIKGLFGVIAALPFLIGMGTLYIANIVRFAAKKEEDIYAYELNKLLQSEGVKDKIKNRKQAISCLNEMISKHKGSVEYDAAVRSLDENTQIFELCLESKDHKLFDGITKFLIEM